MIWYLAEMDESQSILINGEDKRDARNGLVGLYAGNGYTSDEDAENATLIEIGEATLSDAKDRIRGRFEPFRAIDQYNDGKSDAIMWEKRVNQAGSKGLYTISL